MSDRENPSMLGLVVVVGVVALGMVFFFANFSGRSVDQLDDKPNDVIKGSKSKKKGKHKSKSAKAQGPELPPRLPEKKLQIRSPGPEVPAAKGKPNVVVFVWTAARADHTNPYGATAEITPHLQTYASQGVVFDDAITAAPFSRTAGVAMFTGMHASSVGMVEPTVEANKRSLKPEITTLAEHFQAGGYKTIGLTSNFNLNSDAGLAQGYHFYRNSQSHGFNPKMRTEGRVLRDLTLDVVNGLKSQDEDYPVFLMVNFVEAHQPLRIDKPLMAKFSPKKPNAPYRAAIYRLDQRTQEIIEGLKEAGLTEENTIYTVIADHGEGLNEPKHHGKLHGRLMYNTSIKIPWVVFGKSVAKNQRISGLASNIDLTPTLVELAGLKPVSGVEGQSWAEQITGKSSKTTRTKAFSDTWYFNANRASVWTDEKVCQADFGSVDLKDEFGDGCFDRKADPTQLNLIEDEALMKELKAWRQSKKVK